MKTLLSHRINETLMLNRNAPFPSEVRDGHDLVRKWRYEQRKLELVRSERDPDRGRTDDLGDDPVVGT